MTRWKRVRRDLELNWDVYLWGAIMALLVIANTALMVLAVVL